MYRQGNSKNSYNRRHYSGGRSRGRRNFGGGGTRRFAKSKINPSKYVSKVIDESISQSKEYEGVDFSTFDLSPELMRNIASKGYSKTTEIQETAIPLAQAGKDILGVSSTGSGKTGAFLIPLIDKIFKFRDQKILIIAPTRELSQQIMKEGISLVRGSRIRLEVLIGGESISRQIWKLKGNPEIVVGTPGRLLDMVDRGALRLNQFNNIVLDEVDRMLDMGFINDIKKVFEGTPKEKQVLFFSATINDKIQRAINDMSRDYETIKLSANTPIGRIKQDIVYFSQTSEKVELLHEILLREEVTKTLVFVGTKRYADRIGDQLSSKGISSAVIHGDKRQSKRKQVLDLYRNSRVSVLVATDVAARGIDIDDISHVINLDEPNDFDSYIHRIGRTGRNGRLGNAYTFVQKS